MDLQKKLLKQLNKTLKLNLVPQKQLDYFKNEKV